MKPLLLFALLTFSAFDRGDDRPIAIRHDVEDRLYLELGEQYPAVVRVGARGGDGTLIAPDWVLTAAHVADGMDRRTGGTFRVFVDGEDEGYEVAQIILNPGFEPMGPHDIALIRLKRPVRTVEPILPYRDRSESGMHMVVLGHGASKLGTGGEWTEDGQLRGATNVIDSVDDQYIKFDFDGPNWGTELEGTAGPGDSGGPAMIEVDGGTYVAGVSSLGEPGANGPGTYGAEELYVRVSSYIQWIDAMMSDPPPAPNAQGHRRPDRAGPGSEAEDGRAVVVEGGQLPDGLFVLEEIGLLVKDDGGRPRMAGRIDELYPAALLEGGIRPPAVVISLNGEPVASAEELKAGFDALAVGTQFSIQFRHAGELKTFELRK